MCAGDSIAAGVYYSKAVRAFKKVGDMGLAYVRALQAWGSLEAQSRHASRARHLFLESIRVACKVRGPPPIIIHWCCHLIALLLN